MQGTASKMHLKHAVALLAALQQCHPGNQAIVLPHAHHLTDALAAILETLPAPHPASASRHGDPLHAAQQYRRAADLLAKRPVEGQRSALYSELQAQADASGKAVVGQRSALHAELQAQAEHTTSPAGGSGTDSASSSLSSGVHGQRQQGTNTQQ